MLIYNNIDSNRLTHNNLESWITPSILSKDDRKERSISYSSNVSKSFPIISEIRDSILQRFSFLLRSTL